MQKKHSQILREFVETIILTVVVFFFLVTFVVQGYRVYGSCMEPNLHTGERLLGNKFIYHLERPIRGDIVVFRYPPDPTKVFIKRVIGLPGEMVEIHRGRVYVNERPLDERLYVKAAECEDYPPHMVPRGHVFVLGDNRDESNDSRFWGELPVDNIQAKAWLRYWPINRLRVFR